jgi:hypothetical protein
MAKEFCFGNGKVRPSPGRSKPFSNNRTLKGVLPHVKWQDPLTIPIDEHIAGGGGRDFQKDCMDILCREIGQGRRKLLVEMATGTGKTRTAAAFIKRMVQAKPFPAFCFWWTGYHSPSKRVCSVKGHRGFESLSLRQINKLARPSGRVFCCQKSTGQRLIFGVPGVFTGA